MLLKREASLMRIALICCLSSPSFFLSESLLREQRDPACQGNVPASFSKPLAPETRLREQGEAQCRAPPDPAVQSTRCLRGLAKRGLAKRSCSPRLPSCSRGPLLH